MWVTPSHRHQHWPTSLDRPADTHRDYGARDMSRSGARPCPMTRRLSGAISSGLPVPSALASSAHTGHSVCALALRHRRTRTRRDGRRDRRLLGHGGHGRVLGSHAHRRQPSTLRSAAFHPVDSCSRRSESVHKTYVSLSLPNCGRRRRSLSAVRLQFKGVLLS